MSILRTLNIAGHNSEDLEERIVLTPRDIRDPSPTIGDPRSLQDTPGVEETAPSSPRSRLSEVHRSEVCLIPHLPIEPDGIPSTTNGVRA